MTNRRSYAQNTVHQDPTSLVYLMMYQDMSYYRLFAYIQVLDDATYVAGILAITLAVLMLVQLITHPSFHCSGNGRITGVMDIIRRMRIRPGNRTARRNVLRWSRMRILPVQVPPILGRQVPAPIMDYGVHGALRRARTPPISRLVSADAWWSITPFSRATYPESPTTNAPRLRCVPLPHSDQGLDLYAHLPFAWTLNTFKPILRSLNPFNGPSLVLRNRATNSNALGLNIEDDHLASNALGFLTPPSSPPLSPFNPMRSRLSPALSPLQLPLCQPFSDATNPDVDEVEVPPVASMIGLQAEEQAPLDSTVEIDTLAASNYEGLRPSTEMAVSSITEGASSDPIILDDAGSDTEAISPSTSGDTNAITDPPRTADEAHSDNDAIVGEMVYNLTSTQKILQVTLRNPADEHSVLPPTLTIDLSKDQSPRNAELNRNLLQTLSNDVVMEKLTLKAPSDSTLDEEIDQAIFVSSLQVLSELKELDWDGGMELFPKEWMDGNVPWTNLTSLSLSLPLSDMQCLRIIDACSHLRDLHLDVTSRSSSEEKSLTGIALEHSALKRIVIVSSTNTNGLLGSLDPEDGAEWHLHLRNSAIEGLNRLDTNFEAAQQPCAFLDFTPNSKEFQRLKIKWRKLVIMPSSSQS